MKQLFNAKLRYFALAVLTLVAVTTTMACSGMDTSVLAESIQASAISGVSMAALPIWFVLKDGVKNFKVLSDEERKDFTDEEGTKYLGDLIKWQTKSITDLNKQLSEKDADNETIQKQLKDLTSANITAMKSSLESQGVQLAKVMKELDSKTSTLPMTMQSAILKGLTEKADTLKSMVKNGDTKVRLEIKASQAASDIDAGTDFADMLSGVGQIATRMPLMRSLFNQRNTTKEYIKYNDQETVVRDAKNVAGCAATTHNSKITWKVRTLQITKVRDMVDVCIDMMEDYDWVTGEIRDLVNTDVALKVDEGLLLGTDVYPELNSVAAVASTFAAGAYALSVQAATLIDLVRVAACQISDFGQNNKFNANVMLLNPADQCLMTLEKDLNNNYMIPNWITNDGVNIGAVRVLTNQLVPADEAYIMDTTKGTVVSRRGVTVEFGFENATNFEKELVTVKAYERLNFLVRNVDKNAFMHIPSIAAAITAIKKV